MKKNNIQDINLDNSDNQNVNDEIIDIYFKKKLNTDEKKNKYLDILDKRIDENKKSMNRLLMIMLFLIFAFPLILTAKIREINIGPFKINDDSFVLMIIPSIYAYCHYKIIHLQILLSSQTQYYVELLAILFNHRANSQVNVFLRPFIFLQRSVSEHYNEKSKIILKVLKPMEVVLSFTIFLLPYYFTFYSLNKIYTKFGFEKFKDKFLFALPIIFIILSILIKFQVIKRSFEESN